MASSRVSTRLYRSALASIAGDLSRRAAQNAARETARRARVNVIRAGRWDTGKLANSMTVEESPTSSPQRPRFRVRPNVPYAGFQEHGTRAHGPVRAPCMVFRPKGGGGLVFAKWVRGVTPARFMRQALDSIRTTDFRP